MTRSITTVTVEVSADMARAIDDKRAEAGKAGQATPTREGIVRLALEFYLGLDGSDSASQDRIDGCRNRPRARKPLR